MCVCVSVCVCVYIYIYIYILNNTYIFYFLKKNCLSQSNYMIIMAICLAHVVEESGLSPNSDCLIYCN